MIPFELTARRCVACGELTSEGVIACTTCGAPPRGQSFFYSVPLPNLAFFGATTFGLYVLWWFWSQWRAEAPNDRRESAAFKTVFAYAFFYWLAKQVKQQAEKHGIACWYSPVVLTGLWWLPALATRWFENDVAVVLAALLLPVPLLPVQAVINRVNAVTSSDQPRPWRWWQVVIAISLGLFWVLIIVGLLLPTPPQGGELA